MVTKSSPILMVLLVVKEDFSMVLLMVIGKHIGVNGIIKSEGLWRNKHLDSTWRFYDKIGNIESEIKLFRW